MSKKEEKNTKKHQKTILLTNDDGYKSKGLKLLRKELKKRLKGVKIITFAPFSEKSACAHSLSIKNSLELIKIKKNFYAVNDGTPTDCVCLAFSKIKPLPDLVVSGINNGANLGEDVTYSGTLGACMESVLHGVRAIGFSQFYDKKAEFKNSSVLAAKLVKKLLKNEKIMNGREFLSVNYPKKDCLGYKLSPLGKRIYTFENTCFKDPRGKKHYFIKNLSKDYNFKKVKKSDINSVMKGYASITPISLDMTCYDKFDEIKAFLKKSKKVKKIHKNHKKISKNDLKN